MTSTALNQRKCEPCSNATPALSRPQVQDYLRQVPGWELSDDGTLIARDLRLADFMTVIDCVNQIAVLAEEEGHHPNLYIHGYKKLRIELNTHAIGGLSENDFILASKIDKKIESFL